MGNFADISGMEWYNGTFGLGLTLLGLLATQFGPLGSLWRQLRRPALPPSLAAATPGATAAPTSVPVPAQPPAASRQFAYFAKRAIPWGILLAGSGLITLVFAAMAEPGAKLLCGCLPWLPLVLLVPLVQAWLFGLRLTIEKSARTA